MNNSVMVTQAVLFFLAIFYFLTAFSNFFDIVLMYDFLYLCFKIKTMKLKYFYYKHE